MKEVVEAQDTREEPNRESDGGEDHSEPEGEESVEFVDKTAEDKQAEEERKEEQNDKPKPAQRVAVDPKQNDVKKTNLKKVWRL